MSKIVDQNQTSKSHGILLYKSSSSESFNLYKKKKINQKITDQLA